MMETTYFAVEILGLVFILLLLYATVFELKERTRKRSVFTWLLIGNAVVVGTDAMSWAQIDWVNHSSLLFGLVLAAYVVPQMVLATFAMYLYEHISEKTQTHRTPFRLMIYVSFVAAIVFLALCLLGKMFEIREGKYYPSALSSIYYLFYIVCCLYLAVVILSNGKKLGVHDLIAALSFCILPVAAVIISISGFAFSLSVPFMPVEMLIIYIMLQSNREISLIDKGEMINMLAHHDDLTKLNNRRAYEEKIDSIAIVPRVMVVFCDVNGLKEVNDSLGHRAGDELLVRFANLLRRHFEETCIFRISGDEFVILLENETEKKEKHKYLALRKEIEANEDIASVGCSVGQGKDIHKLVSEAETMMYEDKAWYYRRSGKSRRI